MYRPNFCAECGVAIERARWPVWASRRFCPACARRFWRGRWARLLLACLLLFASGFGVGRALKPAPPPLLVAPNALPIAPAELVDTTKATSAATNRTANAPPARPYSLDGTANERPTDPNEIISICGARTRKGTPCQRRVRGTGRCWQHRGQPAMLPPEKLIIQGAKP